MIFKQIIIVSKQKLLKFCHFVEFVSLQPLNAYISLVFLMWFELWKKMQTSVMGTTFPLNP